jgi:endo-1,4-beta-xylanase
MGTFMTLRARSLTIALFSTVLGCAATPAAAAPAAPPRPAAYAPLPGPLPSLKESWAGVLLVGAAANPGQVMTNGDFVARQFAVITAENEMKPVTISKKEGEYNFAMADQLVDWGVKHGVKVRGHCLVWHQQAAPWMFTKDGKPVSRELLLQRMRDYIHTVVGHFKGRVWAWDVVNEAFPVGEGVDTVGGWRNSEWYKIIGPEYVELAFRFAHEADPDALLFYNDYETQNPAKLELILAMARDLKKKGVRIDGVGHQAHVYVSRPSVRELETSIQEIAKLGLRNHITELDMSLRADYGKPMEDGTEEQLLQRQAKRYAELFEMFARNRDKIDAVVFWGWTDETSWLRYPDMPLLWNEDGPKPAFWAVVDEGRRAQAR